MAISEATRLKRLRSAMRASRRALEVFRKNRREAIKDYVGTHYSDNGAPNKTPLDLLELTIGIYMRHLISGAPQALITSAHQGLIPFAYKYTLALNNLVTHEINLGETLRRVFKAALFGWGIAKVGLAAHGMIDHEGMAEDVGQPFCEAVDLDDWVHDMNAKEWEDIAFCGHRFRMPYEEFMDSDLYTNKDEVKPSARNPLDAESSEESVEAVSRDSSGAGQPDYGEYEDQVDLCAMWLPRTDRVLTLPVMGSEEVCVRDVPWTGPERGPYHTIGFSHVPGQIIPLPPVALWRDLHTLANSLFRKLERQALRQKKFLGYDGSDAGDAKRIVEASDGDAIKMKNPKGNQEFETGGINVQNLAFLLQVLERHSWQAGNLDALGGLGPQAETLGQERMITGTASQRIRDMQRDCETFTTGILRDLGLYLWEDPFIEIPLVKRIPGTELEIPTSWDPDMREGDYTDYNFELQAYSLQSRTPGDKLELIMQLFQQVLVPSMPLMQQQGLAVNFPGFFRLVAQYAHLPEVEQLILANQPIVAPEGPVNPRNVRPGATTRTNVRVNRSSGTPRGRNAAMAQTLLGAGVQDSEMANLVGMGT